MFLLSTIDLEPRCFSYRKIIQLCLKNHLERMLLLLFLLLTFLTLRHVPDL